MSRFDNYEWDDLSYEIHEFLKKYSITDLLYIVRDAVEDKEEEYKERSNGMT